jgi:hypothetical protein
MMLIKGEKVSVYPFNQKTYNISTEIINAFKSFPIISPSNMKLFKSEMKQFNYSDSAL